MRVFLPLLFVCLFWVAPAQAQDPLIAKAVAKIAQVEAAEPQLQPGDQATAQKLLGDLAWAEKRLNAVGKNKGTAEWKAAEQRLQAARTKVEAKAKQPKPAPKPNPTPNPGPNPAPKPAPKPGSGPKPTPSPQPAPQPQPKPGPQPTYDHAKVVQLNKEVGNAWNNLKMVPLRLMNDASRVASVKKEIAGFRKRLEAFPAGHENVQIVTANLNDFEALLNGGLAKLEEYRKAAPAIEKRMAVITKHYDRRNFPADIDAPFHEGQVRAWAQQMRQMRSVDLPKDIAYLQGVADNVALKQNAVSSQLSNLTVSVGRQLQEIEWKVRERIASRVEEGMRNADWILETNPMDRNHVLNRILGKGRFDENMQRLRDYENAVAMAGVYDDAMGSPCVMGPAMVDPNAPPPPQPDRKAQAAKIQMAIAHLKQCAESALHAVRMPKAASTDAELLKIAAETLQKEKYEIAGWERLVINTPKTHKEKREAWFQPGTVTSTLSFYTYSWDQFQVTTAEKHGDEIWLYANTLKRYESGDTTTPVGEWILSRRFELTRILPENLDKPPLTKDELKVR